LGGGTSDISIWEENNNIIHQCSVKLAGRDIFSQFLSLNPGFLERQLDEKSLKTPDGQPLERSRFNAKLDFLLRQKGDRWKCSHKKNTEPEFKELIQLTTIGIAGLYYYIGIMLKVLRQDGKYFQGKEESDVTITDIYLAGNGSQFLHWVDPNCNFHQDSEINKLLSRMMSKGSGGFSDAGRNTYISQAPKNEVAYGLVVPLLITPNIDDQNSYIAGESYQVNGQPQDVYTFVRLPKPSSDDDEQQPEFKFEIPTLVQLPKFLKEFHQALDDLDIKSIDHLAGYKRSEKLEDNQVLWTDTLNEIQAELNIMVGQANGDIKKFPLEPPFILGLKALLKVLGAKWASKYNR
jgi:hypothetical protein